MRPLQYDSTFTVRANSDLRAAIAAAAEREGASASDWVRRALASVVSAPASNALCPPLADASRSASAHV